MVSAANPGEPRNACSLVSSSVPAARSTAASAAGSTVAPSAERRRSPRSDPCVVAVDQLLPGGERREGDRHVAVGAGVGEAEHGDVLVGADDGQRVADLDPLVAELVAEHHAVGLGERRPAVLAGDQEAVGRHAEQRQVDGLAGAVRRVEERHAERRDLHPVRVRSRRCRACSSRLDRLKLCSAPGCSARWVSGQVAQPRDAVVDQAGGQARQQGGEQRDQADDHADEHEPTPGDPQVSPGKEHAPPPRHVVDIMSTHCREDSDAAVGNTSRAGGWPRRQGSATDLVGAREPPRARSAAAARRRGHRPAGHDRALRRRVEDPEDREGAQHPDQADRHDPEHDVAGVGAGLHGVQGRHQRDRVRQVVQTTPEAALHAAAAAATSPRRRPGPRTRRSPRPPGRPSTSWRRARTGRTTRTPGSCRTPTRPGGPR